MQKILILFLVVIIPTFVYSQERKLKSRQPNMMELMMIEIKLNPSDTIFNNVNWDYLPVKGYPFYKAVSGMPFYTISQRDSVVKKIDDLFFE